MLQARLYNPHPAASGPLRLFLFLFLYSSSPSSSPVAMSPRKRRALVALQLREDGHWIPGKKPDAAYSSAGKKAAAGTKARAGKKACARKAPAATKAGAGMAGVGTKTRAGKADAATVAAGTPPALTPKVEVTEEESAPGPLLPYPPGFGPKVEDGSASHSTPTPPPPPAA